MRQADAAEAHSAVRIRPGALVRGAGRLVDPEVLKVLKVLRIQEVLGVSGMDHGYQRPHRVR